jgi:hypothetical protein
MYKLQKTPTIFYKIPLVSTKKIKYETRPNNVRNFTYIEYLLDKQNSLARFVGQN